MMRYASLLLSLLVVLGVSTGWVTAVSLKFQRVPQFSVSPRGSLLPPTSSSADSLGTSGDGPGNNRLVNHMDIRVRFVEFI
jgi:hypothetical protein